MIVREFPKISVVLGKLRSKTERERLAIASC